MDFPGGGKVTRYIEHIPTTRIQLTHLIYSYTSGGRAAACQHHHPLISSQLTVSMDKWIRTEQHDVGPGMAATRRSCP